MSQRNKIKEPPFQGIDWSMSIHRPGCQDHLKYPSRRGDKLVPHMHPMGMRSTTKEIHRDPR